MNIKYNVIIQVRFWNRRKDINGKTGDIQIKSVVWLYVACQY